MALDKSVQVAIPEHGIAYKKVGGKTYVYYATAVYRNEKGQPTADRTSIGRLDEGTGKLIPNRNYYEVYLKKPVPSQTGVHACGVNCAVEGIAKRLGLKRLLNQYMPENAHQILAVAQYMLSEGNVMYYLENYTESHKTAMNGIMTDVGSSKMFSSIRQEDMLLFFREWMKQKGRNEYVAYDVTSVSSYARNILELEWGYNRDHEKLPQINIGMYYAEESKLPLYYRVYPGSISDKAHLQYMVADNEFINAKRTRFVMDRGFYSAENLTFLQREGYRFVIALPGNLRYCVRLIEQHRDEIVNRSQYMLGKGLPYGKAFEVTELGFRMKVHLYYDPDKARNESEALYELIDRQENELRMMEEPPDRNLRYDRFFYINKSKDGKLGFIRNHKAIDEALARCGFFLIAETDFKKSTLEILELYRNRNCIENSFDSLKNSLDMRRLRVHNSDTTDGKLFCAFIALILSSYIQSQLGTFMRCNSMTMRKLLLELDKIKCFELGTAKPRLLNPVSKCQREIFELLKVPLPQ